MDKARILQQIIQRIARDRDVLFNAAKTAHEAAIHEENIPDNKYDTLGLEASYVAQGQANRAREIALALDAYKKLTLKTFDDATPIRLTALVTLQAGDGSTMTVFIGPLEGGLKLQEGDSEIVVVTPGSPLGRNLIGRCAGDTIATGSAGGRREYEIAEVC